MFRSKRKPNRPAWLGATRYCLLAVILVFASAVALPAAAQKTPTPNEIDAVAKDLWCPLCNGVRLDNCELQACVQMREVINQKLTAGESREQIKAYFVTQYGDVVLGAPANEGFSRLVWILPWLAAVVALAWLVYLVRAWTHRRAAPSRTSAQAPAERVKADNYLSRVEEELKKMD
jgi:cytochrome c-type biogenesis protein CcmH